MRQLCAALENEDYYKYSSTVQICSGSTQFIIVIPSRNINTDFTHRNLRILAITVLCIFIYWTVHYVLLF